MTLQATFQGFLYVRKMLTNGIYLEYHLQHTFDYLDEAQGTVGSMAGFLKFV